MKISELVTLAPALYQARRPLLLEGAPGIGKSDALTIDVPAAIVAANLAPAMGHVTVNCATLSDVSELLGYQLPGKSPATGGLTVNRTEPEIARLIRETGQSAGVLFLDELPQASQDVQKALCTLILTRALGEYRLPPGWWVVAAGNRQQDRAGASRLLSILTNRVTRLTLAACPLEWLAWTETRADLHPLITGAVDRLPGLFADAVPAVDQPFCTPRSLTAVAHLFGNHSPQQLATLSPLDLELIEGTVGQSAARQLVGFLAVGAQLPTMAQIALDPLTAPLPETPDARYAAARMVAALATPATAAPAVTYLTRLPFEFLPGAFGTILRRGVNAPAIAQWVSQNRQALAAVQSA